MIQNTPNKKKLKKILLQILKDEKKSNDKYMANFKYDLCVKNANFSSTDFAKNISLSEQKFFIATK